MSVELIGIVTVVRLHKSTKDRPSEKLCLEFLKRLPDAYLLV